MEKFNLDTNDMAAKDLLYCNKLLPLDLKKIPSGNCSILMKFSVFIY